MIIELPDTVETALVFSDLHLGDPRTKSESVLNKVYSIVYADRPDLLVLDGDVLEGHLATPVQIAQLRGICHVAKSTVILKGNHDSHCTKDFASSVHAQFGLVLIGQCGTSSFAIEHGHRFDTAWHKVPGLGKLAIWLNRIIYEVTNFDIQHKLHQCRCVEKKLLEQHKRAQKVWDDKTIVITGHTHLPTNDPEGVGYFNPGDWMYHQSYVSLIDGKAKLVILGRE